MPRTGSQLHRTRNPSHAGTSRSKNLAAQIPSSKINIETVRHRLTKTLLRWCNSALEGVSCASASACTAVGYTTGFDTGSAVPLAEIWNGTAWVIQATPSAADSGSLAGASCSPAGCTAVGASTNHRCGSQVTLAERWNGATWTIQATSRNPAGAQNNALSGVSWTSARDCVAVGSYYNGLIRLTTGGALLVSRAAAR